MVFSGFSQMKLMALARAFKMLLDMSLEPLRFVPNGKIAVHRVVQQTSQGLAPRRQ